MRACWREMRSQALAGCLIRSTKLIARGQYCTRMYNTALRAFGYYYLVNANRSAVAAVRISRRFVRRETLRQCWPGMTYR